MQEVMTVPVVTAGETIPVRHLTALLYAGGIDDRYPAMPAGL